MDGYYRISTEVSNQWIHGVMMYHGTGKGITVYEGGVIIGLTTSKIEVIGSKPIGNGYTVIGKREMFITMHLDEIKMYNRQLSVDEIQNMY